MSFFVRILRHSSQSIVAGLTGAVGSFVAAAVIARTLGVEGTATVGMALWIIFLTTTLADIGITGTLSRFLAAQPHDRERRDFQRLTAYGMRIFSLATIAGLILTAVILRLYWSDIIAKYAASEREGVIFCIIVLLCFVVHMLYAFSYQLLRGLRAFGTITLLSLVGTVAQIILVFVGIRWLGANGALLAYVGFSLPMLWALTKLRPADGLPPLSARRQMRSYATSFYAAALFSPLLWVRIDVIFVDQLRAAREVGLFVAASTLAALLLQVSQMVCNALLPNIVHAAKDGEEHLRQASRTAVRFGLFLLLPASAIVAAVAPQVIVAIYGAAFAGAGITAALLCLAAGASGMTLVVSSVLSAADANAPLARNGVIGAGLTIVFGVALVWQFGLVGAAGARIFAQSAVAILNLAALRRRLPDIVQLGWLVPLIAASLCGGAAAFAVITVAAGILIVPLAVALGGIVYLVAALIWLNPSHSEIASADRLALAQPPIIAAIMTKLVRLAGWRQKDRIFDNSSNPPAK
jgi:O-antigen/teichoic acid export membrane protein